MHIPSVTCVLVRSYVAALNPKCEAVLPTT